MLLFIKIKNWNKEPKNSSATINAFLFFTMLIIWASCGNENSSNASSRAHLQNKTQNGTLEMANRLMESSNKIDYLNTPYLFNKKRAKYLADQVPKLNGIKKMEKKFQYGLELLKAGNAEQAIMELEEVRGFFSENNLELPQDQHLILLHELALAYLRLGEEENCLENNTKASCIVPIAEEAVYSLKIGSKNAIKYYEEILAIQPDNYEAIWLMNLAHMTLGTYPSGVPAKYRIPAKVFQQDEHFPQFENIANQAGVNLNGLAGSCVFDDIDNDGWLDIVTSSWGFGDQIHVFISDTNGGFIDKTEASGILGITGGLNLVPADFDNDGLLDIFVLRGAWMGTIGAIPNSLLRNTGDGTFEDVTIAAGLYSENPTQTAVWTDVNLDGWIDLFIGNESINPCEFYLNNGDGTFTEMAAQMGLNIYAMIKGSSAGDINNDGWPDLYVSVYNDYNKLMLHNGESDPSKIRFTDVSKQAGVQEPKFSFPVFFLDFNNDGWQDIFVSGYGTGSRTTSDQICRNLLGEKIGGNPRLYINKKNNSFKDISEEAGLTDAIMTMGSNYGDLNNDGYLDFYLATGSPDFSSIYPNRMFLNKDGKTVEDVTYTGGFGHIQKGHGVGFGDYDHDGDSDIYMVIGGAYDGDYFQNALFQNPGIDHNNSIYLRLIGSRSNKSAIGARIKLTATDEKNNEHIFYRTVSWGGSFGASSLRQEIGVGKCTSITSVEINWPYNESKKQVFTNLPINSILEIEEGQDEFKLRGRLNFGDLN